MVETESENLTKGQAIRLMRKKAPHVPGWFWYDVNKKGIARLDLNAGAWFELKIEEIKETTKILKRNRIKERAESIG